MKVIWPSWSEGNSIGQTSEDAKFQEADSLLTDGFYKESFELFEQLSKVYEDKGNDTEYLKCLNKATECLFLLGQFGKSMQFSKKILKICSQKKINDPSISIMANIGIGKIHVANSTYDEASKYLTLALDKSTEVYRKTNQYVGYCYYELGLLYSDKGDNSLAIEAYNRALEIQTEIFGEVSNQVANIYHRMGMVYLHLGALEIFTDYFSKSFRIRTEIHGAEHPAPMKSINDLGAMYKVNKTLQSSLDLFEQFYLIALKIQKNYYDEMHPDIANSYHNWGVTLYYGGRAQEAKNRYLKALQIQTAIYDEGHPDILLTHISLGQAYASIDQFDSALYHFNKSLQIQEENGQSKNYYRTIALYNLGNLYARLGETNKALEYAHESLISNHEYFNNKDVSVNPNVKNVRNNIFFLGSIHLKAKAYQELYQKNGDVQDLISAYKTYLICDEAINQTMVNYQKEADRIFFSENFKQVYSGAITVTLDLFEQERKMDYYEKAFYFSEKSRSNALRLSILESGNRDLSGFSDTLNKAINIAKYDIAFYESSLRSLGWIPGEIKTQTQPEIRNALNGLFEKREELRKLMRELEISYPEYYTLKYGGSIISVLEIQDNLDDKSALIEYFRAEDFFYTFIITKSKLDFVKIPIDEMLDLNIEKFGESIVNLKPQQYVELGQELYQHLFQAIDTTIDHTNVILVPDDALWHINFDLLLSSKPENTRNFKSMPYLLRDYSFSYANSANLLFGGTKHEPIENFENTCLAFSFTGDTTSVSNGSQVRLRSLQNTNIGDLPGSRQEIKAISEFFDGDYYYGDAGDKMNFKKNAGAYDILHLAIHGVIDDHNPKNSRLIFSPSKDKTLQDQSNSLYVNEIYSMSLKANIAVLSSCNTGNGLLKSGEGAISIGRAFLYSGVKSLVVSNWEASDRIVPLLMKEFYKNLKDGKRKNEALRTAKLKTLELLDGHATFPFYWANFVLIGNPEPLSQASSFNAWYLLVLLGIIIAFLLFRFRYRLGFRNSG